MTEQRGRLAVAAIAAVFVIAGITTLAGGDNTGVAYLGFGFTGFAVVGSANGTRRFLIGGGVLYVMWHFVIADTAAAAGLSANDWLNLWLAGSMIALACLIGDRPAVEPAHDEAPLEWRPEGRSYTPSPSARPRRPRPTAGSRPAARRRDAYAPA